jgi:MYXO-CTERM domain-containing protein
MADGTPPPSMSQPDGGSGPAPGAVGSDCTDKSQCNSGVCAKTGSDTGYCTQTCDPSAQNSCPSGTTCGEIDSQHYCVKSSGGCSYGGGGNPTLGALLMLALAALLFRRQKKQG